MTSPKFVCVLNSWVLHSRRCGILPTHPASAFAYMDPKCNGYDLIHNMSDPKQLGTSLICSYVHAVWGLWYAIWAYILRDFLRLTSFYKTSLETKVATDLPRKKLHRPIPHTPCCHAAIYVPSHVWATGYDSLAKGAHGKHGIWDFDNDLIFLDYSPEV